MKNKNQLTRTEQVCLVEYQVCYQDSRSLATVHWMVVGIFFAVNIAALTLIANQLNSIGNTDKIQWIILASALAAIGIMACLWMWLNRANFLIRIDNIRMEEIEKKLNMRNIQLRWELDTNVYRRSLRKEGQFFPYIPCEGSWPIKVIYIIFTCLWISAIIAAFNIDH